ncbi:MAG: DUF481 domain-containing protein [Pirellulales bacterium]|nr:DUF481 domain-containing protein [Pirellulales bacterium]
MGKSSLGPWCVWWSMAFAAWGSGLAPNSTALGQYAQPVPTLSAPQSAPRATAPLYPAQQPLNYAPAYPAQAYLPQAPPAYPPLAAPVATVPLNPGFSAPPPTSQTPVPTPPPAAPLLPPTPTSISLPSTDAQPELLAPAGTIPPSAPEAVAAPPGESAPTADDDQPAATVIVEPIPEAPPKLWSGRIEAGINGADGNTQLFSSRFGTKLARETPQDKFKFDLLYGRSENFGKLTENKAILEVNQDWNISDSPYAWFVNSMTEYDEFRNFDVRLTLHSGLTYHAYKGDQGFLDLRAGAGTAREIGSPDNEFVPESKLGFDLEYKLTPRQKITGSSDAFVDVTDISHVRVNSRAGYAIALDTARNLNLEFGLLDRYDSTPNGAKPNDIDYNVLLFWGF